MAEGCKCASFTPSPFSFYVSFISVGLTKKTPSATKNTKKQRSERGQRLATTNRAAKQDKRMLLRQI